MRRLPAMLSSCLMIAAVVACASTGGTAGSSGAKAKSNTDVITTAEIDAGNFRDAYDVVQRLRPTWFTKARATSSGSLSGTQVSGSAGGMSGVQPSSGGGGLVVYLDNTRMGGPEALRDLPASSNGKTAGPWIFDHHGSDCRERAIRALIGKKSAQCRAFRSASPKVR